jgi:hypothetical protein
MSIQQILGYVALWEEYITKKAESREEIKSNLNKDAI